MYYNIILTVSVESKEIAEELLETAKEAVIDTLDYEVAEFIAGIVQRE